MTTEPIPQLPDADCGYIHEVIIAIFHERRHPDRLEALLHPEFVEIGRSGWRWTRAEIIASLLSEPPRARPTTDEWQFATIAPGLVLVTYRIAALAGTSRHSSLWDVSGAHPVIRFHQGTAVSEGLG
ncbi:DUF4440 domain-containing protein [Microbacterium sp.]|uniref:nuclear transport factor 2 family protein n=1 Tax=Microbacterium sp. TaxID=51671 RepID=UPI0039E3A151